MADIASIIVDGVAVSKADLRDWLNAPEMDGGPLMVNLTNGGVWIQSAVTGNPELHVRPNAGSNGRISFTEDSVSDRWVMGIIAGDGGFYWSASGSLATNQRMILGSSGGLSLPGHGTTASAANTYIDSTTGLLSRSTSSLRYKMDIKPVSEKEADAVLALRPITYRSTAETDDPKVRHFGLAAEEVAEIEPRLVHWSYPDDAYESEGKLKKGALPTQPESVQYERICVLLLDVVRRQEKRIKALEGKSAKTKGEAK